MYWLVSIIILAIIILIVGAIWLSKSFNNTPINDGLAVNIICSKWSDGSEISIFRNASGSIGGYVANSVDVTPSSYIYYDAQGKMIYTSTTQDFAPGADPGKQERISTWYKNLMTDYPNVEKVICGK